MASLNLSWSRSGFFPSLPYSQAGASASADAGPRSCHVSCRLRGPKGGGEPSGVGATTSTGARDSTSPSTARGGSPGAPSFHGTAGAKASQQQKSAAGAAAKTAAGLSGGNGAPAAAPPASALPLTPGLSFATVAANGGVRSGLAEALGKLDVHAAGGGDLIGPLPVPRGKLGEGRTGKGNGSGPPTSATLALATAVAEAPRMSSINVGPPLYQKSRTPSSSALAPLFPPPPQEPGEQPDELDVYRGLVLDSAYRPVNVVCWKRALCLEISDKADVLEYYDAVVQATNQTFPIPAVLRVSHFVHNPKQAKRRLSLSRNNIFLRDKFKCQYCGAKENLTIDHVRAVSRGGGSSWENLVTACSPCNLKKGDKTPAEAGMILAKNPREPKELDSRVLPTNYKTFRSLTRHRNTPKQWLDWLPLQPPRLF